MKKVFASLGVIMLVAVLGVAIVFAYNSYQHLEFEKEQAKLADEKQKIVAQKQKHKENQTNLAQENTHQEQVATTVEQNIDTSDDPNNIMANDTNGDGVVTRDEMTPELEKLEKEGKFQVASKGIDTVEEYSENNTPKYTVEDARNMNDDEFLNAYKEGMPSENAEVVDELANDPAYVAYLRGQIEARANGQGGTY